MLPSRHIIVSLPLGAGLTLFTGSAVSGLLCLFGGVLIDIDHIIEYSIHYGFKNINFQQIYQACRNLITSVENGELEKIYLFFHAAELSILLWVSFALSKNIYLLAIALGYTGHLTLDVLANEIKPWAYFISLRAKKGFRGIEFIKLRQN